ncbi:hypothetical protein PLICRDRAFT_180074 [Plicaturopsis crispa FD-325 SS-3]|uniref:Sc15 protein n=1 Tax=Plicaturopsis crispa FD-325 SS-3 TaxID=944288 RepID=A0A0C9SKH1_PLICR|nr:hypothetical protein PLICRDRAFT_180074 [Plicaturopsis crispa FD-325 SS-3]
MFTARITSFFLFVLAFGVFTTSAIPATKRATPADVEDVLNTLQSSTGSITPQIDALVASNQANSENIAPLVSQLTSALNTASASLTALDKRSLIEGRQVDNNAVASTVAGVVSSISTSVSPVAAFPGVVVLLPGLDLALSVVLKDVEHLLAGVLKLVAVLLVDVGGLLKSLAFTLTLLALGL